MIRRRIGRRRAYCPRPRKLTPKQKNFRAVAEIHEARLLILAHGFGAALSEANSVHDVSLATSILMDFNATHQSAVHSQVNYRASLEPKKKKPTAKKAAG